MTPEEAMQIIAQDAIHNACAEEGDCPEWDDYPDIGQHDWVKILHLIDNLTLAPSRYSEAYELLKSRADHGGDT